MITQTARDSIADTVLEVRLLGSFLLQYGEKPLQKFNSSRLQILLAYLLLNRQAPVSRRHAAFQFWPDSSEAQAFANFRNLLAQLRGALPQPDSFLTADGLTVQWKPSAPYRLDVESFELALSEGDLEGAAGLYAGDLLPDCYEEWIAPERERLRGQYSRAVEALVQTCEEARDYEGATRWTQAYLLHDPIKESTYRRLMRLHALQGSRAEAVRVYHHCAQTLQRELGVDPAAETRKLYEQLLRGSSWQEPDKGRKKNPPLAGRSTEWRRLLDSWQDAAAGSPGVVLLTGEAGIGKTRLLEEFQEWARYQGITTAYARCYAAQNRLAYAPAAAWLRGLPLKEKLESLEPVWLGEIARLLPEILTQVPGLAKPGPIVDDWQRTRLFEALARAVFTAPQPLLLVLDDLQWADPETLAWLSYLVRYQTRSELLVLVSARPEEPGAAQVLPALRLDLQHDGLLAEFELQPLGRDDSLELISSICERSCSEEEAEKVYLETEGHPLFIVEMVRSRAEEPGKRKQPGSVGIFSGSWVHSGKVEAVIASRLSELSGCAQAVAALAAAGGRQFHLDVLSEAWKSSGEEFVDGLDELWRRRIVREQGEEGYDFTHDKIREAVYQRLSPAHRRLLHRILASAMERVFAGQLEHVSGEIAAHYQKGGSGWLALPYFLMAGQRAARLFANQEAIAHLGSGKAILSSSPLNPAPILAQVEITFALLDLLGDVLERIGEHQEARQAYEQVFDCCPDLDPLLKAQTYRKIGQTWLAAMNFDAMLQSYTAAEQSLEPLKCTDKGLSRLSLDEAWCREWLNIAMARMDVYYFQNETGKIQELAEEIVPVIQSEGTPLHKAELYFKMANMILRRGRYTPSQEAIDNYKLAVEAALETIDEGLIADRSFSLGFSYLWAGRLSEAEAWLLDAAARAEKTGYEYPQILAWTYLGILYRKQGQVEHTRQAAARSMEMAVRGNRLIYIGASSANQSWLAWRDGDYGEARRLGEAALDIWSRLPIIYAFYWTALWPLIGAALADGDLSTAVQHVQGLLSPHLQPPPRLMGACLQKCLEYWEGQRPEEARLQLHEAVLLAKEMGYL